MSEDTIMDNPGHYDEHPELTRLDEAMDRVKPIRTPVMTSNTAVPLKPCPFCGGKAEIETIEKDCFGVGCPNCDFQLMNGQWAIGWHRSSLSAATEWNRRTEPATAYENLSATDLIKFKQTAQDFEDFGETETDYSMLLDWAARGLLECDHFRLTKKGRELIAAPASSAGDQG
jgi:hypothetical protein